MTSNPGVIDFTAALRRFLADWPQVDTVACTFRVPGGAMLTVRLAGNVLEMEDDTGALVTVPLSEVTR